MSGSGNDSYSFVTDVIVNNPDDAEAMDDAGSAAKSKREEAKRKKKENEKKKKKKSPRNGMPHDNEAMATPTLLSMPQEIILEICNQVKEDPSAASSSFAAFSRTCRYLHNIVDVQLYRLTPKGVGWPMAFGAASGNINTMRKALYGGADVNAVLTLKDDGLNRYLPLDEGAAKRVAEQRKYVSFANAGLIQDVPVDTGMHSTCTPLSLAVISGENDAIQWLLGSGAAISLNIGSKYICRCTFSCGIHPDSFSPLHLAVCYGHLSTVQLLVRAGVPLESRTMTNPAGVFRNQTIIHTAAELGYHLILDFLLQQHGQHGAPSPSHGLIGRGHNDPYGRPATAIYDPTCTPMGRAMRQPWDNGAVIRTLARFGATMGGNCLVNSSFPNQASPLVQALGMQCFANVFHMLDAGVYPTFSTQDARDLFAGLVQAHASHDVGADRAQHAGAERPPGGECGPALVKLLARKMRAPASVGPQSSSSGQQVSHGPLGLAYRSKDCLLCWNLANPSTSSGPRLGR
ncbi:hypothetical protein B0H63DRAFT_560833 [Podospora didyma]|uniref:Ankyrin repeat protein n=1 Tax=Podospora didyma TaxID=330526 RepID=A0AAE0NGI8_9PEZI|nr:hypothetical protein B0H63DRAFT_560833 [Podospora didyma]